MMMRLMQTVYRMASGRRAKKIGNRGAGIVMVIVAIALVSVLTSVLASIALLNMQMKSTERKSKENFYDAETALDQIHVGLEGLISLAIQDAYTTAMQQYKMVDSTTGLAVTEAERLATFRSSYMNKLIEAVSESAITGDDAHYLIGNEHDVDADASTNTYIYNITTGLYEHGILSLLTKEYAGYVHDGFLKVSCNVPSGTDSIVRTTNGVLLKGISIEYTGKDGNNQGYFTKISTDILMNHPDISFSESTVLPNVYDYAFVAQKGINIGYKSGISLTGNAYSGEEGIVIGNGYEYTGTGTNGITSIGANTNGLAGLQVNAATEKSSGSAGAKSYLVTGGEIQVPALSSVLLDCDTVWAQNLSVTGSQTPNVVGGVMQYGTVLEGSNKTAFYIADDLEISKHNVSATIEGSYFGYGNGGVDSSNPDESSSIIVNGANTNLDFNMTNGSLLLAGTSFIDGRTITGTLDPLEGIDEADTRGTARMGASLSVKTDQIVFLAPTDSLKVGDRDATINPMTKSEYNTWLATPNHFDINTVSRVTNKTLASYDSNVTVTPIFRQVTTNSGNEILVYIYLKFSNDQAAADYARDYMANAGNRFNSYLKAYNNQIKLSHTSQTQIYSAGNVLTYQYVSGSSDENNGKYVLQADNTYIGHLASNKQSYLRNLIVGFDSSYKGLCYKLTTNLSGLNAGETGTGRNAYNNIINESAVKGVDVPTTGKTYSTTYNYEEGGVSKSMPAVAFVINNEGGAPVEVGSLASNTENRKINLVIATGDVFVRGNYEGLIFSGGTISVYNSLYTGADSDPDTWAQVTANRGLITKLLEMEIDADNTLIGKYFINGTAYVNKGKVENYSTYVDLDSLITYRNWTKG
ncbi:MAG: hypothetical protein K5891_08315 [Lachnospiraceae bacterium]|nr:hypothetical protein [Lachnospiraceae bacterium]